MSTGCRGVVLWLLGWFGKTATHGEGGPGRPERTSRHFKPRGFPQPGTATKAVMQEPSSQSSDGSEGNLIYSRSWSIWRSSRNSPRRSGPMSCHPSMRLSPGGRRRVAHSRALSAQWRQCRHPTLSDQPRGAHARHPLRRASSTYRRPEEAPAPNPHGGSGGRLHVGPTGRLLPATRSQAGTGPSGALVWLPLGPTTSERCPRGAACRPGAQTGEGARSMAGLPNGTMRSGSRPKPSISKWSSRTRTVA